MSRFQTYATTGNLTGSVTGNTISATLASDIVNTCASTLNGTVAGTSISGTYATTNCPANDSGSFTVQAATPGPSIAGSYSGTLSDSISGAGTLSMSLTQHGLQLGGTYTSTFSNAGYNRVGPVYGFVSNSQVTIIQATNPTTTCPFFGTGNVSGTTISGTFAAFQCTKAQTGTFTLTHQ